MDNIDNNTKVQLIYKFGLVRHLVGKSNVAVWNPKQGRIFFALPQEFVEDTSPHFTCHAVSIEITPDRFVDDKFEFTNKVWDEIENEVDTGNIPNNGEIFSSKHDVIQWILSNTSDEGNKILTMMTTNDWTLMLDPVESAEALIAIEKTILKTSNITTTPVSSPSLPQKPIP
jgi:hypothetical protein